MKWEEAKKILNNIQTIKALSNGRPGFISGIEQSILFDLAEFLNSEIDKLKAENEGAISLYRKHKLAELHHAIGDAAIRWWNTWDRTQLDNLMPQYKTLKTKIEEEKNDD